jgi:hypothetical protein
MKDYQKEFEAFIDSEDFVNDEGWQGTTNGNKTSYSFKGGDIVIEVEENPTENLLRSLNSAMTILRSKRLSKLRSTLLSDFTYEALERKKSIDDAKLKIGTAIGLPIR